jgi:integrase
MPKKTLTETGIAKLKPPAKGRLDLVDEITRGLVLRTTATGVKSWCFVYRFGGVQRRFTFGRYLDINLKEARILVKEYRADLAIGNDPKALRDEKIAEQIAQEQDDISVADLAVKYIELYAKRNTRRWKQTEGFFNNHILPELGSKKAKDLTRRDVVNLLDKIKASEKPTAANHVLACLKGMYSWAVERDEVKINPCAGIKKPVAIAERERVLSRHEIGGFWEACNQLGYPFGPLCQLLLLTGQRCNEIARLKWSYISFEEKIIRIPPENIKAGRGHDVPLSNTAIDILRSLPRFTGEYIFSTTCGQKPVSGFSKTKKRFEDYFHPQGNWRFHDLRRTCATYMAQEGIPLHTISRVLGHAEGGITKIYARHSYLSEKREALNLWAHTVADIVGDKNSQSDNVVRLKMIKK